MLVLRGPRENDRLQGRGPHSPVYFRPGEDRTPAPFRSLRQTPASPAAGDPASPAHRVGPLRALRPHRWGNETLDQAESSL